MKLKLGIIGLGIISPYHEKGIAEVREIVDVAGICDIDLSLAKERAGSYGAPVYSDYRELLADPEIDTVDIILPHNLHYPVCRDALEAGKNVIMEKPFVIDSGEGKRLIELAKERGCLLSVAENTPFVEAYLRLKEILQEGRLGRIYSVRTMIAGTEIFRMIDKSNWKGKSGVSGGGVVMDAAPHSFFLLNWLFGRITELQAYAGHVVPDCEIEDNAVISGLIEDKTFFESAYSFTAQAPWTERLEVYGEKGTIIIDQIMKPSSLYYQGAEDFSPLPVPGIPYDPIDWKGKSISRGIASFLQAVHGKAEPVVSPEEALISIELCEKAYESLNKGIKIRI